MMLYTVFVAFCWEVRTKNAGNDNVANKVSGIFFHHNCFQSIPRKWPERLERGGPCWLLKLRWMGTQRGHMIGVLPWLVGWTRRAGTKDFCPALAALVSQIQNIIFHTANFFTILVPIAHATWAGGRAGSPVCVSLEVTEHMVEEKQYSPHASHRKRSVKLYLKGKLHKAKVFKNITSFCVLVHWWFDGLQL